MKTGITEHHIHKAIMQYLQSLPTRLLALTIRNMGTVRNGRYCPSRNVIQGCADIVCFPKQYLGKVIVGAIEKDTVEKVTLERIITGREPFFLEVKKPKTTTAKGIQRVAQKAFEIAVSELGYDYFIVYSVDDVQKILRERGII